MAASLILGEFRRTIDDRFRLSIPAELIDPLFAARIEEHESPPCILAKERAGCLSLWPQTAWQTKLDAGVKLVEAKIEAGKLAGRIEEVQLLGRLLSSRHKQVELAARGRLLIPEGFREFLGVEAGGEVLIVGAALCLEIWKPKCWIEHLAEHIPEFHKLFDQLSG